MHAETSYFILDSCVYRGNETESAIKISATSTSTPMEEYEERQKKKNIRCLVTMAEMTYQHLHIVFYLLLSFCIWGRLLHFFFILASCFCVITLSVLLNCLTGFLMSQNGCQSLHSTLMEMADLFLRVIGTGPTQ